ncbi:TIGR03750 family conjugal transfer protein [Azotobacter salinestris]|uniref:TIGR03750 family conjugal transfer protein n=1 Tax=Azotobacter salinestris TaxID=69964 RepID=UPI0032DF8D3F
MSDDGFGADGTMAFLPNRLNRQPVIVMGLTADEMWLTSALGAALGLALGITLAILFGSVALVATCIATVTALGLLLGGRLLRRLKRGRPDTWLYRQMQWAMTLRWPWLSPWIGGLALITRSGFWTTHRTPHRIPSRGRP